jgi:hypothetical protein
MTNLKTPNGAITRVLKNLGLVQRKHFRVTGERNAAGERLYTYAYTMTRGADQVIADTADRIEAETAALGFPFVVSIRYHGKDDRPTVSVHNSPSRLGHVREERPAPPAPAVPAPGNVTITLPADYAAKALEQLREVRKDGAVRDATTAVHVLVRRLEDALSAVAVADVTDPGEESRPFPGLESLDCDTCDATPAPDRSIVTVVGDLNPTVRYALWACDTPIGSCMVGRCKGQHMVATGTGEEISRVMEMWSHRYAERLDS